jgi:SAM-dependent methyltransferase
MTGVTPPALLHGILDDGQELRPVGDDIWSMLAGDAPGQRYDRRARVYDALVGSPAYNRLAWGSAPRSYSAFAERAVRSGDGPFLDAGCGSLLFTADAYARARRPLLLVDQSIAMLRLARARLRKARAPVPDHFVLLQADLRRLPFRDGSFPTVLCMGILHLFDDPGGVAGDLARVAPAGGQLFLSSLVAETWRGTRYLNILHAAGEVARPKTLKRLLEELEGAGALAPPIEAASEGCMSFILGRVRQPAW